MSLPSCQSLDYYSSAHAYSLFNLFASKLRDITFTDQEIHQYTAFFCRQIPKYIGCQSPTYVAYANGQKAQNSKKSCTPFWASRLVIYPNNNLYLDLIPPKDFKMSRVFSGTAKTVKLSVSFAFRWAEHNLEPILYSNLQPMLPSTWSVYIKHNKKKADSLKTLKDGYKKHVALTTLGLPNFLEAPFQYPVANKWEYTQTWLNTDALQAIFTGTIPLEPFKNNHLRISKADLLQVMLHTTTCLNHLHQHGTIHNDVKPANMLIAFKDGTLKGVLADFDLSETIGKSNLKSYFFWDSSKNFHQVNTPFADIWGFTISLHYLFFKTDKNAQTPFIERAFLGAEKYFLNENAFLNDLKSYQAADPQLNHAFEAYKNLLLKLLKSNIALHKALKNSATASLLTKGSTQERLNHWHDLQKKLSILTLSEVYHDCHKLILPHLLKN